MLFPLRLIDRPSEDNSKSGLLAAKMFISDCVTLLPLDPTSLRGQEMSMRMESFDFGSEGQTVGKFLLSRSSMLSPRFEPIAMESTGSSAR